MREWMQLQMRRQAHEAATRETAPHYRKMLNRYQQLVIRIKAFQLTMVKAAMCALKEKEPEEVMAKPKEEGFIFFTGLPEAKQGDVQTHQRYRARGMESFLRTTSKKE